VSRLDHAAAWIGAWTRPTDPPARAALGVAAVLLVLAVVRGGPEWLASMVDLAHAADRSRRRRFLTVTAFFAAFLSLGYIAAYLRGGPRAADAAMYWLQGRALSHGHLSWVTGEPMASFRVGDLAFQMPDRTAGGLPPGYPLLLAMGFLVGAPMLVGPLVAAAIVTATWLLAHEVIARATDGPAVHDAVYDPAWGHAEVIARLAVGFSVVSAAMRYHTADAIPEGSEALAVTVALACAFRVRRTGAVRLFGVSGAALGFLVASSPPSAFVAGAAVALVVAGTPASKRASCIAWACAGALPGVALLLAANRAATGHLLTLPLRPWPSAVLAPGARWGVWLRLARVHLLDIANLEPLALLLVVPLFVPKERAAVSPLVVAIVGMGLAQALPGHNPANLPSEGTATAAGLVPILPLEHVLLALGVARLGARVVVQASVGAIAASVAGFAVHASHAHEGIAASGLGKPRFEPDVAREANVTNGLVFFEDDEGFALAHDPTVTASHGILAARLRGDDHDRLLYDRLGRPPSHRYSATGARATLAAWAPFNTGSDTWRFEAESEPPVARIGGLAEAISVDSRCASDAHVLRVSPAGAVEAVMTLELPIPSTTEPPDARVWTVVPRVLAHGDGGEGTIEVVAPPGPPLAVWTWSDLAKPSGCMDLPGRQVGLGGAHPHAWLVVHARGGPVMVDRTTLRPR
jgi:hypothetical protein